MTGEEREGSLSAYRLGLERESGARLWEIARELGADANLGPKVSSRTAAAEILDRLRDAKAMRVLLAGLSEGARALLGLLALTEGVDWPPAGARFALECLDFRADESLRELADRALIVEVEDGEFVAARSASAETPGSASKNGETRLIAHPNALAQAKTILPDPRPLRAFATTRQVHGREADGLEPLIRLAGLWQRVLESPPRRSRQGTIYKRDRERFEDDPAAAGPIADALEPLPDMAMLWLSLAGEVGLIQADGESDRLVAASAEYWAENAVHLPQMIAARWLSLWSWHETHGFQEEGRAGVARPVLAAPFLRLAALCRLASLSAEDWIALEDLAAALDRQRPGWDRLALTDAGPVAAPAGDRTGSGIDLLKGVLLGAAYQFGLVRAAEKPVGGGTLIQITEMGRYVLRLGPPPQPREGFEKFLYVQPNFEVVAYRQGLTPREIGRLARFARFVRVGGALELKLTPESVYQGLEGGLTAAEIGEYLARHGSKAPAESVLDAIATWSDRRERITYHANATLVEFADADALEEALSAWDAEETLDKKPTRINDRMLLAADDRSIPFGRFRQISARDYRREPEVCVTVEEDGVTLRLDPERSDLFIDAELAKFAEELPLQKGDATRAVPRRRFRITVDSIARGLSDGLSPRNLEHWFARRAGSVPPPAIELLIAAASRPKTVLSAERTVVLNAPAPELIDGLLQHPRTGPLLGERLGPTAIVVPIETIVALQKTLEALGFVFEADFQAETLARPSKSKPRGNPPEESRRPDEKKSVLNAEPGVS